MQNNTVSVQNDEIEIDLYQLIADLWSGLLRNGWLYLALMSIVGTIVFFAARMSYSPYYEAYTTFTVNTVSTVSYNSRNQKNSVTNKMGKVFPYILTSDALKSIVIEDMGYSDSDTFPAEIEASVVKDTNLVTLKVKSDEPQIAYKQMDESGFPKEPANTPGSRKAAAIAMLVVLLLCLAWLAFKSVTRRTIRTEEELTRCFNAEYLGNMPSVVFKKRSRNQNPTVTIDAEGIPFAFVEAIRTIRHRVEREAQKCGAKVILVTSALQSEGKTTTSTNLAIALANRKHNVLLVDGDLRNPSILPALGMEPAEKGMVDLLLEKAGVDEILMPYKERKHLAILPGGKPIDNPTALWSNEHTEKLIHKLRDKCDYVIIDAPPSAVVSDASLIARITDGCVYVVRQDYAGIDTLREGMEMFSGTGCKLLGCVLNHAEAGGSGYGYGRYGYGKYGYGKYGYGKSRYGYGYGESGNAETSEE